MTDNESRSTMEEFEQRHSPTSFRGEPVTGETYEIDAMEWFQTRDGKICTRFGARD